MVTTAGSKNYPELPTWLGQAIHVGITGTNGKTTTSRFLASILNAHFPPVVAITTTGSFLGGTPFANAPSLQGQLELIAELLRRGGKYAVLETTSEVLARGMARVWPYRAAVFTNLTQDHLDAHGSFEHYFASKAQLFVHLPKQGLAVINGCDDVAPLLDEVTPAGVARLFYGVETRGEQKLPLDVTATDLKLDFGGTSAILSAPRLGIHGETLRVPAHGAIFVENALGALCAALGLGLPLPSVLDALAHADMPEGRFEVIHREPDVVVDYAHTPDALERTLKTARELCRGKLWVVFGAGGERDKGKRPLLGRAAEAADRIILTSDNPRSEDPEDIAQAIRMGMAEPERAEWLCDRRVAIGHAIEQCNRDDLIVIAGKGHEREQTSRTGRKPFSDRDVAEECLRVRSASGTSPAFS